ADKEPICLIDLWRVSLCGSDCNIAVIPQELQGATLQTREKWMERAGVFEKENLVIMKERGVVWSELLPYSRDIHLVTPYISADSLLLEPRGKGASLETDTHHPGFPLMAGQGATESSGVVSECISGGGGGGGGGGCSEGEEGECCLPAPGMCSQLAGKDVSGASSGVLALFPELRPSAFIHGLVLRAFSSSIVPQGLSKGFMPLTCAKYSG
ncbi:hypothetical protein KUCAC02_021021, partial [Chaenocephalus aceratus]